RRREMEKASARRRRFTHRRRRRRGYLHLRRWKGRAVDAASGDDKWTYTGSAAFFAGPAVAGGVAYAADLQGVIHAIGLKDGKGVWAVDLAADPAVSAPGMIFGSPILHDGKIYVATCNIDA